MYQKLFSTYMISFNPFDNTEKQKLLTLFLQMRILRVREAPNSTHTKKWSEESNPDGLFRSNAKSIHSRCFCVPSLSLRNWKYNSGQEIKDPVFPDIPTCFPSRFTTPSSLSSTGASANRMMSRPRIQILPALAYWPSNQDPEEWMLLMCEQTHHDEF